MQRFLFRLIARLYGWAYQRLYNELAWSYDLVSWLVSFGQWDSWRRTALRYVQGERVLEVAFGTGELLPLLAVKAENALGLEASAAMQRIVDGKLRRRHLRIPRVQGVVQRLPFAGASLDAIVSTFPAGFILDPDTHREFARVLRPGERVIVVDVQINTQHPLLRAFYRVVFPPVKESGKRFATAVAAGAFVYARHVHGEGAVRVVVTLLEKPR